MPQSKHRKAHKTQLNKRKSNIKQMNEAQNKIPPVRSVPVWQPEVMISLKGFELEALANGLGQIQLAQQALQSVISRNIVDGVISLDFEKYDPQTNEYVPMTDEEKAPYRADVERQRAALKNPPKAKETSAILNADGLVQPTTQGTVEQPATDAAKVTKPAKTPKAKVVKGNFAKETPSTDSGVDTKQS